MVFRSPYDFHRASFPNTVLETPSPKIEHDWEGQKDRARAIDDLLVLEVISRFDLFRPNLKSVC